MFEQDNGAVYGRGLKFKRVKAIAFVEGVNDVFDGVLYCWVGVNLYSFPDAWGLLHDACVGTVFLSFVIEGYEVDDHQ